MDDITRRTLLIAIRLGMGQLWRQGEVIPVSLPHCQEEADALCRQWTPAAGWPQIAAVLRAELAARLLFAEQMVLEFPDKTAGTFPREIPRTLCYLLTELWATARETWIEKDLPDLLKSGHGPPAR